MTCTILCLKMCVDTSVYHVCVSIHTEREKEILIVVLFRC